MKYKELIDAEVPADDSTAEGEKMLLYWLIRELKPETVIETGTHKALTALYMAHALHDNQKGHLTTYDPYPDWGAQGNINKILALQPYITYIPKRGDEMLVEHIDFAFIDGFHGKKDVEEELAVLLPRLAPFATVIFHDCWYGGEGVGVNEALEEAGLHTIWLPTTNALRVYSKHPITPRNRDI